jgi:hypothetical protein
MFANVLSGTADFADLLKRLARALFVVWPTSFADSAIVV